MEINNEVMKYLNGEKFSSGYTLKISNNVLYDRITWIKTILNGKKVLHVGCCDHLDIIEWRRNNNSWLQGILDEVCDVVQGIDINNEAVDYVNGKALCKRKVLLGDVTDDSINDMWPRDINFDFVLLGEILEHVDNPVDFLKKMSSNLKKNGFKGKIVITVPNAMAFARYLRYRPGFEPINTDHRYWFTPFTISKVMYRAGMVPKELIFASNSVGGVGLNRISEKFFKELERIRKKPIKHNSYLGDTIIAIGEIG